MITLNNFPFWWLIKGHLVVISCPGRTQRFYSRRFQRLEQFTVLNRRPHFQVETLTLIKHNEVLLKQGSAPGCTPEPRGSRLTQRRPCIVDLLSEQEGREGGRKRGRDGGGGAKRGKVSLESKSGWRVPGNWAAARGKTTERRLRTDSNKGSETAGRESSQ